MKEAVLALAAAWLVIEPSAAVAFDIVQITNNSTTDGNPAISGSNVVWTQCDGSTHFACSGGDLEIYFWDGSFPIVPIQITNNSGHDSSPAISGSNVVWQSWDGNDYEIYLWDGSFPIVPIQITNNSKADHLPVISGSNMAWRQCDVDDISQCDGGDTEIYFWDGIITTNVSNNSSNHEEFPDISGSIVVWQSCFWDAYIGCVDDREIYMASIPVAPVPAISFGGLALLAGLVLGTAVWATRRQWT